MKVSEMTYEQLPTVLADALKVKNAPTLDWELCGKLIEKEKISLIRDGLLFMLVHVLIAKKLSKRLILL